MGENLVGPYCNHQGLETARRRSVRHEPWRFTVRNPDVGACFEPRQRCGIALQFLGSFAIADRPIDKILHFGIFQFLRQDTRHRQSKWWCPTFPIRGEADQLKDLFLTHACTNQRRRCIQPHRDAKLVHEIGRQPQHPLKLQDALTPAA